MNMFATDYMSKHGIRESLQPAYHKAHFTETAIIFVLNCLVQALDSNDIAFVSLLDSSVVFDLVDHTTLLNRLSHHLGITGVALDWFHSYLSGRSQPVSILPETFHCGVPQETFLNKWH